MCVPPFKIAFYHLGAMVHIETNCYNTSRFFSRKFMCVHELYILLNQKILHFKKTHTHKLVKMLYVPNSDVLLLVQKQIG